MKITLKDGSSKEYSEAKSVYEIAKDISEGLARAACAGEVDGEIVDLRTVLDKDCTLNIITASDEEGLRVIRHTASHVLAQAVKNLFPDAKITIGPAIDDGFYYDFDSQPFSREDLDALEAEMKKIIKQGHEITRFTLPREEAIKFMKEKDEPYKVELIEELPEGEEISFYDQGGFVDLCAGPHLMSTKGVKAFKLTASSMAYWRGDSNKARLHRIYGTAYNKKEDLKAHLERMEEAKKRDHNKLGREMELFTTVDVIGQGLPLMMPKGTKMIMKLQRWIEDLEDKEWGYVRTKTPLMAKSDLYKISGHWDHYLDGMFVLGDPEKDGEEEVMALRPMTCPFQYYVYKAKQRSYRDLAYDRLIFPSLEREVRSALTDSADEGAIGQFALNLKPLLMQPPVKGKVTMGLDPGYRMGCKVAVVDGTGKVLDTAVVYPTHGERQKKEAIAVLARMIRKHGVEHIAIGNGTASRETEQMAVELIHQVNESGAHVSYMIVSEAGASVYSASPLAAEEFPQFDVNLRSAVSIARRLQDPLAELVKIDPKAIGVGQYQHDMPPKRLDEALGGVVEDCVNAVGVDVNTASPSLLQHVAGLTATTAKNVVAYREANGPFGSIEEIMEVSGIGEAKFAELEDRVTVDNGKGEVTNEDSGG